MHATCQRPTIHAAAAWKPNFVLNPAAQDDNGRQQFDTLLDGALMFGRERLIEIRGTANSGKSQLLERCVDAARRRGCTAAVVRADDGTDGARHPLLALTLRLLGCDAARGTDDALKARIWARCRSLALPAIQVAVLQGLVDGASSRPALLRGQATALCMLIERLTLQGAVVIGVDGLQRASWALAMALEQIVPATLPFPVVWIVTSEQAAPGAKAAIGAGLDAMPRAVYHTIPCRRFTA